MEHLARKYYRCQKICIHSFKKFASSIRFIIKIKIKNIPETKNFFKKIFLISIVYDVYKQINSPF